MRALLVLGIGSLTVGAFYFGRSPSERLETVHSHTINPEAPAMCPWREPQRDIQAFFPGATDYTTQTVALSRRRLQILKRLGPGGQMESTALYVNHVTKGSEPAGTVLVRRTAGQFGGIEVVVGIFPNGRIAGVRIQRHREPPQTAAILSSPEWLRRFEGKTASSPLTLGVDLPPAPESASASANAVTTAIRTLMIEYDEANADGGAPHH